jgi:hypothetical protein
MAETSYRLGHYEIVEKDDGGFSWKSHGGFASIKTGKCFIEGDILFLGYPLGEEHGQLKNEFLNHLGRLPTWRKTTYYCPKCTLYHCHSGKVCSEIKSINE